jgi:molybdopterin-guanine dinucleotide biosynthesis protein A
LVNNRVAIAILNGGSARRMGGQDKSRLILSDGKTILQHQLEVLAPYGPVALVGGEPEPGLPHLSDRHGGRGPLDGLASALAWSPEEWLLLVAGDQPSVQPALLDLLLAKRDLAANSVVAELESGTQPMPGLYHRNALEEVERRLKALELRLRDLVSPESALAVVRVPESECRKADPELASFKNLNRPEDLALI